MKALIGFSTKKEPREKRMKRMKIIGRCQINKGMLLAQQCSICVLGASETCHQTTRQGLGKLDVWLQKISDQPGIEQPFPVPVPLMEQEFQKQYTNIVQLGPSLKVDPKSWFGPKRNTEVTFNTHHYSHKLLGHFQVH